jgi:hypothetical protein
MVTNTMFTIRRLGVIYVKGITLLYYKLVGGFKLARYTGNTWGIKDAITFYSYRFRQR